MKGDIDFDAALDALNNAGNGAAMESAVLSTGYSGINGKKYTTNKHVTGLNPEIEKFFDEELKDKSYSTFAGFIKAAIYNEAVKCGYKD